MNINKNSTDITKLLICMQISSTCILYIWLWVKCITLVWTLLGMGQNWATPSVGWTLVIDDNMRFVWKIGYPIPSNAVSWSSLQNGDVWGELVADLQTPTCCSEIPCHSLLGTAADLLTTQLLLVVLKAVDRVPRRGHFLPSSKTPTEKCCATWSHKWLVSTTIRSAIQVSASKLPDYSIPHGDGTKFDGSFFKSNGFFCSMSGFPLCWPKMTQIHTDPQSRRNGDLLHVPLQTFSRLLRTPMLTIRRKILSFSISSCKPT